MHPPSASRPLSWAAVLMLVLVSSGARASEPAAVVEAAGGPGVAVQEMDFLYEGEKVSLTSTQTLSLSYLKSCAVEQIAGPGDLFVGFERSVLHGDGKVTRKRIKCAKTSFDLSARQGAQSAATVLRDQEGVARSRNTVYSRYPVFAVGEGRADRIQIEAAEDSSERYAFKLKGPSLDTAGLSQDADGRPFGGLKPGVRYVVSSGVRAGVFAVDGHAEAETSLVIDRLVGF